MIVYSLLLVTFLFAGWSIGSLLRPFYWSRLLMACSVALFIHLYGAWIYLSFYLKFGFDALFLLALLHALIRHWRLLPNNTSTIRRFTNVLAALLFAILSILYFTGTKTAPAPVALRFPFKSGDYFVLQGGNGYPANFFHASSSHSTYAMDIVKLNAIGQRSRKIFSQRLDDYFIFADTIYSPCAGIVRRSVDDNPDNIPPSRLRGAHNLNNVLIEANDCFVFLGHLKQARVFVKAGDVLAVGTPIGLAGNSGFSIEPHLHIQVHQKEISASAWYTLPPVPVSFNGHVYRLFEKINAVGY